MFRKRQNDFSATDNDGVYHLKRTFGSKKKKTPLRRFECFDNEIEEKPSVEDMFLDEIAQKICLLTLQISRVENRLSAYETQPNDDFKKPHRLREPPNCPPVKPIQKKKVEKVHVVTRTKITKK